MKIVSLDEVRNKSFRPAVAPETDKSLLGTEGISERQPQSMSGREILEMIRKMERITPDRLF